MTSNLVNWTCKAYRHTITREYVTLQHEWTSRICARLQMSYVERNWGWRMAVSATNSINIFKIVLVHTSDVITLIHLRSFFVSFLQLVHYIYLASSKTASCPASTGTSSSSEQKRWRWWLQILYGSLPSYGARISQIKSQPMHLRFGIVSVEIAAVRERVGNDESFCVAAALS